MIEQVLFSHSRDLPTKGGDDDREASGEVLRRGSVGAQLVRVFDRVEYDGDGGASWPQRVPHRRLPEGIGSRPRLRRPNLAMSIMSLFSRWR